MARNSKAVQPQIEAWIESHGEDGFFRLIGQGLTVKQVAKTIGVDVSAVHRWLDSDRLRLRGRLRDARRDGADGLVEEAGEILDELEGKPVTSAEVSVANLRAQHRIWKAGVWDREQYGEQKGQVNVQLNFGSLMLEALQVRGRRLPSEIEAPVVEAQLLPPAEAEDDGEE